MSDEQFGQALKWFEQLSTEFRGVREEVGELRRAIGVLTEEVHEVRELMSQLQDDARVQRRAIADHDRRLEALEPGA